MSINKESRDEANAVIDILFNVSFSEWNFVFQGYYFSALIWSD